MLGRHLEQVVLVDLFLRGRDHGDDVAVGHRRMYQNAGRVNVRHDVHQVERLMAGRVFHLQRVGQAAVVIARVGDAADDGDGDLFHADSAVDHVYRTDEAGGVAAGQLEELLAQALFVVCITMEEYISDVVLFAALEDGLFAHARIEFLVLRADAGRSRVKDDVALLDHVLHRAGDRHTGCLELVLVLGQRVVEMIGHAGFHQTADRQSGGDVRYADQFHILLQRHARCQTETNYAVTCHANFNLAHNKPPVMVMF